jgi:hypothetical protein
MSDVTLADVRVLYRKADSFATEAGEFREDALIPAHNELRYVGYHLLKALNDDGSVADHEHLYKAKGHCERAMYDAAEAGIMAARDWIGGFRDEYKRVVVRDVVDGYSEILIRERKARDLVSKGRHERTPSRNTWRSTWKCSGCSEQTLTGSSSARTTSMPRGGKRVTRSGQAAWRWCPL